VVTCDTSHAQSISTRKGLEMLGATILFLSGPIPHVIMSFVQDVLISVKRQVEACC
jgi:hypothetical protein